MLCHIFPNPLSPPPFLFWIIRSLEGKEKAGGRQGKGKGGGERKKKKEGSGTFLEKRGIKFVNPALSTLREAREFERSSFWSRYKIF